MSERLEVHKTYKLYINGGFPRTESGRSMIVEDDAGQTFAHVCQASRKDLRDAVEAAQRAQADWSMRSAYNRGQILYRMSEMLEGKTAEFQRLLVRTVGLAPTDAQREVDAGVDRLVCFAGWADKFAQVLGCQNPVAGPYNNVTRPESIGVIGVVAPDEPALLGLVTLIAPAICAGNSVVAIASDAYPVCACLFGEVCSTADVPPGVINLLTAQRDELIEPLASHRDVDAIVAANMSRTHRAALRAGAAENLKRVDVRDLQDDAWFEADETESPWQIEPLVEMKTVWHPTSV